MANAQDNQSEEKLTDFHNDKPNTMSIERKIMPRYEFDGVQYFGKGYYLDSVYLEKDCQIGVLRDGTMLLQAFKIKEIGVDKYFALPMQNIYQVYSSRKNTEEEEKIILSYVQDYQERVKKEKKEAERLRKFIADNPWPFKTVFRGNTYTRTEFKDSDQGVGMEWYGEKIGETTEYLKGETAYPKDYLWHEGQSKHSAGSRIHTIKGIDPLYYIYVDGYIYANDAKRDAKLESELKIHSQDNYRKVSWARGRHSYEYNLKSARAFSPNTIQKMVDLEYPELDQPVPDNSLLQIRALYLDIRHCPAVLERGAVSGYFEVDFSTTTEKPKSFSVQGYGLPMARAYDFKKKDNTNYQVSFHFRGVLNTYSYSLYSELIDNEIPAKAKPTSKRKPNLDNLLIRLANNTYRSISYHDLPESTQKAINVFIQQSLQMY